MKLSATKQVLYCYIFHTTSLRIILCLGNTTYSVHYTKGTLSSVSNTSWFFKSCCKKSHLRFFRAYDSNFYLTHGVLQMQTIYLLTYKCC